MKSFSGSIPGVKWLQEGRREQQSVFLLKRKAANLNVRLKRSSKHFNTHMVPFSMNIGVTWNQFKTVIKLGIIRVNEPWLALDLNFTRKSSQNYVTFWIWPPRLHILGNRPQQDTTQPNEQLITVLNYSNNCTKTGHWSWLKFRVCRAEPLGNPVPQKTGVKTVHKMRRPCCKMKDVANWHEVLY